MYVDCIRVWQWPSPVPPAPPNSHSRGTGTREEAVRIPYRLFAHGDASKSARDLAERGAHTLHIGTFPTAGALLLPPAVKALRHAGVHISLNEGELPTLLQGLRARELHAALVLSQPGDRLDLDDDFELYPLPHDPLQVVLPEDHRCADQTNAGELARRCRSGT
ncbi:LysR substrate-binding domain-containing protein [Streptomyces sp. NBC_00154]|uniref:LysR substrate-binding domain-containing protein n=1 Tax=Streptomyces sp. NBC_00154 TaxID=2975670 RepID=UPI0022563610|nr:LysR substrate-binding domain-containing protein [Streptomyces sp. NBC_00154]MCX5311945.1 LysR substrate-binding domain-containing protein [Streptomyces sp. NBC_00154]